MSGTDPTLVLEIRNLVKSFGALRATDGVSLQVRPGEIHALIGPNGAGKTTLVAQLSGQLKPDQGQILFMGQDITAVSAYARVGLGLVRSFQITRLFKSFSVLDNVALAVQSRQPQRGAFWRSVARDMAVYHQAGAILQEVGLTQRSDELASALSHGEQRVLELALALATEPKMLLLDEPMAGTGPEESQRVVELIESLRRDRNMAILLVEHDMDAVFRLADRISVLVNGALIASGTPEAIRQDTQVRAAYLGEEVTS
ncbi:MAG: ABC transporter ATP-binding protein [Betaproteobacteria bacterium]|nr:ABC transporter ATP-binding protein [Betaproteobacteria bacterium]NBY72466.1 ABC transporter ATP-binding protein [Betaproteobacteria bacterium]NDD12015.1 ABC transporter ATP-binding protein [Betaproteobacteria bacterium]